MGSLGGHISENTWNARLANAVRSRGFPTADFELILPTLRGIRKPDVPFQSSEGFCFVSAKLGSDKEADGVASASEYQQSIGEVSTVAEAFSLTYPSGNKKEFHLRVLANKKHTTISWVLSDLDAVADKIAVIVRNDWEIAQVGKESTITSVIRVLRSGVIGLSSALTKSPPEDFENLFGGKYFFENVLGYEKIGENQQNDLKSAAAYLLVNQILFYEILVREAGFTPITKEDLTRPEVLKPRYFDQVLKIDYRPIFNFDVASRIRTREAGDSCKKVIIAVRTLFPERIDHDIIGKVFHNVIPLEIRKVVAAYFTNNAAGDLLARLSIQSTDDKVLDPACGSGTLLVSAYKRKLELSKEPLTIDIHEKYVERELTGIDIMPFSAHLAAVNLALLGLPYKTDNIRIAIEDSTKQRPGNEISSARQVLKEAFKSRHITDYLPDAKPVQMTGTKTQIGTVALHENNASPIKLEIADVILMNPPFTSNDNLPSDYKKELARRFSVPSAHAKCIGGKLSFQAYFLLLADRFLKKDGRIACVLPFSTFVGKAFKKLNEFLIRNYTVDCIVYGLGRSAFSDNTNFSEILFVARKGKPKINSKFVIAAVKTPPTDWSERDVASISEQIQESRKSDQFKETNLALTNSFKQSDLIDQKAGLTQLTLTFDRDFFRAISLLHESYSRSGKVRPFGKVADSTGLDLFAYELRIKGGRYYGFSALSISASESRMKKNTDVFVYMDEDSKAIRARDRFTNDMVSFPRDKLCGQVRRLSEVDHMDVSLDKEYIVSKYYAGLSGILRKLYPSDEAKQFEKRLRQDWEKKIDHGVSNFVFTRKVDLSASGTRLLSLFSEEPRFLSADSWGIRNLTVEDSMLTLWFNSTLFLTEILSKRTQTRGSWGRIDEHYVFEMNCVDPSKIVTADRTRLLSVFDEVGKKRFPSLMKQLEQGFAPRTMIDLAFLQILGVEEETQKAFLKGVYSTLYERLKALKKTMKGD